MEIVPFFLRGGAGNIFITLFRNEPPQSGTIFILVPPLLDEMNKSRRMLAKMANILVANGYDALIPDLYGTGDSEGEFADANWEIWNADFDHLITWCQSQDYHKTNFIALRSGALFLLDYLSCHQTIMCERLILWHPITNGDSWLTQFLRLHIAANLSDNNDNETTKSLKSRLANGESLEIAGYELSAKLANKIKSLAPIEEIPANVHQVLWMDIVAIEEQSILPKSRKVIDCWKEKSGTIDSQTVIGHSFWSATEIVDVDALINQTQIYISENK